jgi:hypothetical protein
MFGVYLNTDNIVIAKIKEVEGKYRLEVEMTNGRKYVIYDYDNKEDAEKEIDVKIIDVKKQNIGTTGDSAEDKRKQLVTMQLKHIIEECDNIDDLDEAYKYFTKKLNSL